MLIGIILSFYENNNIIIGHNTTLKNIFVFICAVIFCGGYMTGSDWHVYEIMYEQATWNEFKFVEREHGFYILMLLFKKIGFSFFPFMIICRFFVFYIVKQFISDYSNNFYFTFSVFLASNALFIFVDNPLRFMIAFGILIIAIRFLMNRKFIPYVLLTAVAFTFHISSVIMIIICFMPYLIGINKKAITISIYLLLFILLTPTLLGGFIEKYVTVFSLYTEHYLDNIQNREINIFSIGRLAGFFFFIIIVLNRDEIISFSDKGKLIYKFTIIYFYISLLSIIPTFFRLSLFVVPFFYISISIIFFSRLKLLMNSLIITYLLFSPIRQIYSTFTYLPYTNYFTSLFETEKSYNYRVNYNKIKYLERTGEWPIE